MWLQDTLESPQSFPKNWSSSEGKHLDMFAVLSSHAPKLIVSEPVSQAGEERKQYTAFHPGMLGAFDQDNTFLFTCCT